MSADPNALLAFKQLNLKERLEVYREEITLGENAVAALRRQQAAYEERATVVATEWNALQTHVETLASRVTGGAAVSNPNATAGGVSLTDPFLQRLVHFAGGDAMVGESRKRGRDEDGNVNGNRAKKNNAVVDSDSEDPDGAAKSYDGLDDDAQKTVDALKHRSWFVKELLGAVLDAVDAANKNQSSESQIAKDLDACRARVALLDAKATADVGEIEMLREQTTKQRKRNEELGKKLEDTVADVELFRRALRMARSDAGQIEGLPPMATALGAKAAAAVAVSAAAGGGKAETDTPLGAKTSGGGAVGTPGPNGAGSATDGASSEELAKLQGLVHELEGRLKATSENLESTSVTCASLKGDVRGLKHELIDENRHLTSRAYKQLERRLYAAHDETERFRVAMGELQRASDLLRQDLRASTAMADKTQEAHRRAQLAEARVYDAETRARSALDERDKVSLAGQNAQTTASKRKLEEERVIAIAKLRQENAQLRVKVTEARLVKTELDAARAELRKAVTNADANEARAKHAVAALEAVSRGKTGDAKTVVDLELRLASATREASDAAAAACAAQTALAEKQTETDAFMAEMEAIGAAYEDAANDNERLMERLAERDAGVTKAVTEKNQAQLSVRRLRDDLQGMEAAVKHERGAAQAALARANAIERGFDEANFEIKNAKDAAALASLQMATQTKTLTEAHEASEQRKFLLQAAEQKVEALLLTSKDDAAKVTECERKLQKCEETCAGLKRRNEKLAKHGGSAEEYKEEIDAYKQMLRCSVCNDRPKGVIITRCFHMFCNDCIAIRLENRARKCPGCGLMFSASDVKAIFF